MTEHIVIPKREYNSNTITVRELRDWLAEQPDEALVIATPISGGPYFGIVGHAPSSDPDNPVVVLVG